MRPEEIQWMYGGGAAALKPLAWHQFVSQLPARERGNPVLGYYKRLLSADPAVRTAAVSGDQCAVVCSGLPAVVLERKWVPG
jgi:hypothetical protein